MTATALKMRSPIYSAVEVTAPTAGYTAGQILKIEDTVGCIVTTAALGVATVFVYSCERVIVPKAVTSGVSFVKGDKVYLLAAGGAVTNDSSGTTLCGRALEDAAVVDDELLIELKGNVEA